MNNSTDVSSSLRKALLVATKLQMIKFRQWVQQELNGYEKNAKIPEYRYLNGEAQAFNPNQNRWMPVIWSNQPASYLTHRHVAQPVAQIQDLLSNDDGDALKFHIPRLSNGS